MRALVIEDDDSIARLNRRLLEPEGFRVETAGTAPEAIQLARSQEYDLIVRDMMLPDGSGMHVLETIRKKS